MKAKQMILHLQCTIYDLDNKLTNMQDLEFLESKDFKASTIIDISY